MATKIGIAVCRHFGIEARPMSVEALAMNAEMVTWIESGENIQNRPGAAWGVGVANDSPPEGSGVILRQQKNGWNGHLVIEIPGLGFMDLNSGQFMRPNKGIFVPPGFFWATELPEDLKGPQLYFQIGGTWVHEGDGRTAKCAMLSYRRSKSGAVSEAWQTSPDWLRGTADLDEIIFDIIANVDSALPTGTIYKM